MKKFLVVLLILAVAGGLFAQELKLSGYVNSGLQVNMQKDVPAELKAYGFDAGVDLYRFQLNGAFTMENMGVNFRIRSQGNPAYMKSATEAGAAGLTFIPYAYGYVNLFDKMLKIMGGIVDDGAWNTKGDIDDDAGEGIGALIQLMPMQGLNLGMGVYTNSNGGSVAKYTKSKFVADQRYTFGAAYTMPDLFRFAVSMRMQDSVFSRVIAGLQILAVKDLTAVVEFVMDYKDSTVRDGLYTTNDKQPFEMTEKVAYKMDALGFGVTSYQFFNGILHTQDKHNPLRSNYTTGGAALVNTSTKTIAFYTGGFYVEPWISYAIGKAVPQLAFKLSMHNFEDQINSGSKLDASIMEMRIKPSVRFNLPSSSFIDIAYEWHRQSYSGDNALGNSIDVDARYYQRVYVDFVWKF